MLEWTGERFLPWLNDPALAYEHLHRYLYASQFAHGKSVLDLASGEGYGSNLLAQTAANVVGVDIAPAAVEHARSRYARKNLDFLTGSITNVPITENGAFDLVTCFEAIEHIEDQAALLREISRLLKSDGMLIVSTPNKTVYDRHIQEENEFHVKELEFGEFRSLLETCFRNVLFAGQRIYAQSNLWPLDRNVGSNLAAADYVVQREDGEFKPVDSGKRLPMYYIAFASNAPMPAGPGPSVLIDNGNELLNNKDLAIRDLLASRESLEEALRWREIQIVERDKSIQWFDREVQNLKDQSAAQKDWYESEIGHRQATIASQQASIASQQEALAWRAGQVEFLEKEKGDLITRLESTLRQLGIATGRLEAIHASRGWRIILRMRHYRDVMYRFFGVRRH